MFGQIQCAEVAGNDPAQAFFVERLQPAGQAVLFKGKDQKRQFADQFISQGRDAFRMGFNFVQREQNMLHI